MAYQPQQQQQRQQSPSRSPQSVSGDIVYLGGHGRPGDPLKELLGPGRWNVNWEVTQSSVPRVKKSLLWFAVYWSEPGSLQMLLMVEDSERRANLKTLEDALGCSVENPDERCLALLRNAIQRLKQNRRWGEAADAEELRLCRELEAMNLRRSEIEEKLEKSREKRRADQAEVDRRFESVRETVGRLKAKVDSLGDDMRLIEEEAASKKKQIQVALQSIEEAERKLGVARQQYETAHERLQKSQEELSVKQRKRNEAESELSAAQTEMAALEAKRAALGIQLQRMDSTGSLRVESSSQSPAKTSTSKAEGERNLDCPICFDSQIARHLQCGHCVCITCADLLEQSTGKCPFDRQRIIRISPLFL